MASLTFPTRPTHLEGAIPCVLLPSRVIRPASSLRAPTPIRPSGRGRNPSPAFLAPRTRRAHLKGPIDRHTPLTLPPLQPVLARPLTTLDVLLAATNVAVLGPPAPVPLRLRPAVGRSRSARIMAGATEVDGSIQKAIALGAMAETKEAQPLQAAA